MTYAATNLVVMAENINKSMYTIHKKELRTYKDSKNHTQCNTALVPNHGQSLKDPTQHNRKAPPAKECQQKNMMQKPEGSSPLPRPSNEKNEGQKTEKNSKLP